MLHLLWLNKVETVQDTGQDIVVKGCEVLQGIHHWNDKVVVPLDLRQHLTSRTTEIINLLDTLLGTPVKSNLIQHLCHVFQRYNFVVFVETVRKVKILLYIFIFRNKGGGVVLECIRLRVVSNVLNLMFVKSKSIEVLAVILHFMSLDYYFSCFYVKAGFLCCSCWGGSFEIF